MGSSSRLICFAALLLSSSVDATTYLWRGASGQLKWNDPGNWAGGKIPTSTDDAQIATSGTYDVTIDQDTTIASLTIGSGADSIRLIVAAGVTFTVTSNLEALCPTVTILGTLNASKLFWSGQYLDGSLSSNFVVNSAKGRVIVNELSLVKRGIYDQKYIRNVIWTNRQNFTVDPSMDSSSRYIFCLACRIVNEASSTMTLNRARLQLNGNQPAADVNGFSAGIVNRGLLVFELLSNVYVYWDVGNYGGQIKIVGKSFRSSYSFYCYGRWANDGSIQLYGVSPSFYYSNSVERSDNGTWEVYSYPYRPSTLSSPRGQSTLGTWKEYIADVYQNVSLGYWDTGYTNRIRIQNLFDATLTFHNFTTFGRVVMQVSGSRGATLRFSGDMNLGEHGELRLDQYSSAADGNVLSVGGAAQFRADVVSVGSGWTLDLANHGKVAIARRLTVNEGGFAKIGSDIAAVATVRLNGFLVITASARFEVSNRNVTIDGTFISNGIVNLTRATLTTTKEWLFSQGSLIGSKSQLNVLVVGNVTDNFTKTIDGVELNVEAAAPPQSYHGVIAEYFQYRVDTDLTSRISNLYYFPGEGSSRYSLPLEFDSGSYTPNAVQYLSSFDRLSKYYGSSPLALRSDFENFDTNSPKSFTYGYAARLWSFLDVNETGSYKFYFSTGYGLHVRLWINGKTVFTSRRYRYFLNADEIAGPFKIQKGVCRLRIDFIQQSSSWSNDNSLLVNYSGPSFASKPLPLDKLFRRYTFPNGTTEYANSNFNTTLFVPTASVLYIGGAGLIFAKNGAHLSVGKTGVVNVHDDITWFSHSAFGLTSKVINRGRVVKTGDDGVATFFAQYLSRGGSLVSLRGLLEFKDASKDGGLAVWNNPGGGAWDDANNWVPKRVPRTNDIVHVTADGTYQVVIRGHSNISVLSLTLGSTTSQPELIVGHFTEVNIADRFDINSPKTTINGRVTAKYVTFRGETIGGSSIGGEIRVLSQFALVKGLYKSKYIRQINVTVGESIDIDASLDNSDSRLYCDRCYIINEIGSTFRSNSIRLAVTGNYPSAMSDGFRQGLVNYGLFVLELHTSCCPYIYWDVRNYGQFIVVSMNLYNTRSMYYYGSFANYNTTQFYLTNVYFYYQSQSLLFAGRRSVWQMYSYPARYNNAPRPAGEGKIGEWRRYLDDVYQNATNPRDSTVLWNVGQQTHFYVRNVYGSSSESRLKYHFGRFESYGSVQFRADNSRYAELRFSDGFVMDQNGIFFLDQYSLPSDGNRVLIGGNLVVGRAYIKQSWNVTIGNRGRATFHRYVTIYEDAIFGTRNGSGSTFDFYNQLVVRPNGAVDVVDATTICHSNFSLSGSLNIGGGTISVRGRWNVYEGSVIGKSGGTIWPYGGLNVTGDSDKSFSGVSVRIAPPPEFSSTKNGIVADYFQYRVSTDRTNRISNLYYFPGGGSASYSLPSEFDQASTLPNVERFETDVSRFPQYYGSSPLYLGPLMDNADTNSPLSYTYNYAARLWTFLQIDTTGDYTFYFVTGYSLTYRLWIDDVLLVRGSRRYLQFLMEEKFGPHALTKGFHRLRIDFLQASSSWSTSGNTLLVSYSGPGLTKRLIPKEKLFYHNGTSHAKPGFMGLSKTGYCWLAGEGLILGQQSVTVDICSKCEFHVLDDVLWYSDAKLGGVTSFVNAGLLVRRGLPGTAAIYGKYIGKPGSSQRTETGFLEFRDASVSGGLAIWANPNGGSWNDAANWNPPRIPRSDDVVHITLSGSYQVTIPSYVVVNVTSISAGSSRSDVELIVESSAKLFVSDRFGVHSAKLTVRGFVQTNRMIWAGQYIDGASVPVTNRGRLVALTSFVISKGSFSTKYFRYVVVENRGNLTYDETYSSSSYLYCFNCTVYNYGLYSALPVRHSLSQAPSPSPADGFRCGLINYGIFAMELGVSGSSYGYWYWDVRNYGNFSIVMKQWRNTGRFYLYSASLANYNQLNIYMINFYVYSNSYLPKGNGSIDSYCFPKRYDTLPQPAQSNQQGNWQAYLDDIYGNVTAWDFNYQCSFVMISHNDKDKDMYLNKYVSRGNWLLSLRSSRRSSRYFVDSLLDVHRSSQIVLQKYSSVNDDNRLIVASKARANVGHMRIDQGWTVSVSEGASFDSRGRFLIREGAQLSLSSGPNSAFNDSFKLSQSGKLNLVDRRVTMNSKWTLDGQVYLTNSTATAAGGLNWARGFIRGSQSSKLRILSSCEITGNLQKTLDDVAVEIFAAPPSERHGIVAEYFQYRVATSVTKKINNLYYFPGEGSSSYALPSDFDSASTKGNVIRFEPSFSSQPKSLGRAPIAYQSDGWSYDGNSADSFTYNYAARLWAYLKIDKDGLYTFFFSSGYGLHVRLSFDGTVYYTSRRYLRVMTEETSPAVQLKAGFRLMRIDYIQESSSWSSEGGYMSVKYAGPGIPKQLVPSTKLYAVRNKGNGIYEAAAANMKFLRDDRVCKSKLTVDQLVSDYSSSVSHCKVSGNGALLVQNVVNLTVGVSGVLDVAADTDWPKPLGGSRTLLTINGMVVKTAGSGTANLNAVYNVDSTSGCVKSLSGKLEVGILEGTTSTAAPATANLATATSSFAPTTQTPVTASPPPGILVTWKGTSGRWEDPNNWNQRIPNVNDDVRISASSSLDEITVNGIVTVKSLEVTGGQLIIASSAEMEVTNQCLLTSETVSVYGRLVVGELIWSGANLYGAQSSGNAGSRPGTIVSQLMLVQRGSSDSKKLYDIDIQIEKNFTVDSEFENSAQLTCGNCRLVNAANSTMTFSGLNIFYATTSSERDASPVDGFRRGLINNGTVVVITLNQSPNWRWDVRNFGRMTFVNVNYRNSRSIQFYYNVFANWGVVESFASSLYLNNVVLPRGKGSNWTLYSLPAAYINSYNSIPGYRTPRLYKEYINYIFLNETYQPRIWDTSQTLQFRLSGYAFSDVWLGGLTTYGRVHFYVYSSRHSRFFLDEYVRLSFDTEVQLGYESSSSSSYTNTTLLLVDSVREATFGGTIEVWARHELDVSSKVEKLNIGSLSISGGKVGINCSFAVTTDLLVSQTGALTMRGNTVTVGGNFAPSGETNFVNTTLVVGNQFKWTQGQLAGLRGQNVLTLEGGGRMTGGLGKTINNVDVTIQAPVPSPCPRQGVVAEYFQYRVATPTTPRISSVREYYRPGSVPSSGYLPKDFDNASSTANVIRIESTLTRSPVYNGRAPLDFAVDNLAINASSPDSFTYNYAVRWTTFLKIDRSGSYKFYFLTGYGRARMWIDDKVVFVGNRYVSFMSEQTTTVRLESGYRKFRVDNIQLSSSWSTTGNIFYVLYEGPGVPKQSLPDSRLTYCYTNTTTGLDVHATTKDVNAISLLAIDGTGLILSTKSNVTIGQRGQLEIRSNVIWYSSAHSFSSSVHFLNYGILSKIGVLGSAIICGQYVDGGGGMQIFNSGNVDFKSFGSDGCGLALWNNSAGGRWDYKYNWDPPRVPSKNDLAYLTAAGSYQIVVTSKTKAAVDTLVVGGSGSDPRLKIDRGGSLFVSGDLDVYADTMTIDGHLSAGRMTWSGRLLDSSSSVQQGKLVVNQSMVILKGSSQQKYLTNVYLTNRGNLTVDETMIGGQFYFSSSTLHNLGSVLMSLVDMNVNVRPGEIINDGTFVVDLKSSDRNWRCNVTNTGVLVLFCSTCANGGSRTLRFYGSFKNQGNLISYMTSLSFTDNSRRGFSGGNIQLWGRPNRRNGFLSANFGNWSAYVRDIYAAPILWDVNSNVLSVSISLYSSQGNSINSLKTRGYTAVSLFGYSSGSNVLEVLGDVVFDSYGSLRLNAISSSSAWKMLVRSSSLPTVNDVIIENGWTVESSATLWKSTGRLVVQENGTFVSSGGNTIRIDGQLLTKGSFSSASGRLVVKGKTFISSDFNIGNGSATLQSGMEWTDGIISGHDGTIILEQQSKISSDYLKVIDGIQLRLLQTPKVLNYTGVVAEYFQYRVATATTPRLDRFSDFYRAGQTPANGYVPKEFDDLATIPNTVEVLSTLNRFPRRNGNGPLRFQSNSVDVDTTSPYSFTYNYGVRYLAFWDVPSTGRYQFFFSTGYGRYRLWIDGKQVRTGNSYSSFLYEQTFTHDLVAGIRRLRIDLFVVSSSWRSWGSVLLVKVQGPGVPKQYLQNLTYAAVVNGSSLSYSSQFVGKQTDSVCVMEEEGPIVAKNGAGINVTSSGLLLIRSDILWYSHTSLSQTPPKIVNAGLINKTHDDGIATFYADYVDAGGRLVKHAGDVEFRKTSASGGIVLWSNTNGGSWLDPNNWTPSRVPTAGDIVFITARGSYTVLVTSAAPITVKSLIVGGSNSNPTLFVEHLTSISVDHRLDVRSDDLELQGSIAADHFTWSGRRIVGSAASFSKALITARRSIVISSGSQSTKELTKVEIENIGNMTVDETMTSKTIYCYGCRLINRLGGTMRIYDALYWYGSSSDVVADEDGFAFGLINFGLFVHVLRSNDPRLRWNVRNEGSMIFLSGNYPSVRSVRFQGFFSNNGTVSFYAVSSSFSSSTLVRASGAWKVYGVPARQSNLPSVSWQNEYAATFDYKRYIYDLYQNSTRDVYDGKTLWQENSVYVSFSNIYVSQHIFSLQTYGYIRINLPSNIQNVRFSISREMILSDSTLFILQQSSSNRNNSITFEKGAKVKLGRLTYISQGWSIRLEEATKVATVGDVVVEAGGGIDLARGSGSDDDVAIDGQLIVRQSASFNATRRRVVVRGSLTLEGRLAADESTVIVEGKLQWSRGNILGGRIWARGGLDVSSQYSKTLNGASFYLGASSPSSSSGVIAEYFQYRVKTDRTPQRSNLVYFYRGCSSCSSDAPIEFDDVAVQSNLARIERSLSREPIYYGSAPLAYSSGVGYDVDSSSPASFTYRYAVRFSAFLFIPVSDTYTFYLLGGYGQSRLWIDDVKRLTTGAYTSFLYERTVKIHLSEGYHRLRVDNIQTSSGWSFQRNLLIVSISGRCLPKQPLTNQYLTYKRIINGSDVYAAPAFRSGDGDVCSGGESFSQLSDYDAGVSYGTVRSRGLFETVNNSLISIEKTGVLDVQSDVSWPQDSALGNRTRLRILGLAGKSQGSGSVDLNTLYDSRQGCTRADSGSIDFGVAGDLPTVASPTVSSVPTPEVPTPMALVCATTASPTTTAPPMTTEPPTTTRLPTTTPTTTVSPTSSRASLTPVVVTSAPTATSQTSSFNPTKSPPETSSIQPNTKLVLSTAASHQTASTAHSSVRASFSAKPTTTAGPSSEAGQSSTSPSGTAKFLTKSVSTQRSPSAATSNRVETVAPYPSTEVPQSRKATVRTTSSSSSSVTATEQVIVPVGIPKDPTDWSSQDVVAFLESNDEFTNLVVILSDIPGSKLVQLTEDELVALSPENEAALDKLFATVSHLKRDAEENSNTKSGKVGLGIILGASIGVAVLFFVAVVLLVLVCRRSRSRNVTFETESKESRSKKEDVRQQQFSNPSYGLKPFTEFSPVSPDDNVIDENVNSDSNLYANLEENADGGNDPDPYATLGEHASGSNPYATLGEHASGSDPYATVGEYRRGAATAADFTYDTPRRASDTTQPLPFMGCRMRFVWKLAVPLALAEEQIKLLRT
ncbi:uncharacterized protein [Oscarella lobularis]|uniref:uncharacterized protein isoform X3 n=1 Tax=Oscarella lobularis TaxID=121494 RepID=UPI003313FC25